MRDAWALAIEALSWMELSGLSESAALSKTAKQLGIFDFGVKGLASRLVFETVRRKNYLDNLINYALQPHLLDDYDLGVQAFLRLYAYETQFERTPNVVNVAAEIARVGRAVLGWEALQPVEKAVGRLLSVHRESVLENLNDAQRIGLVKWHPVFFVEYCFRLFGRHEAMKLLASSQRSLPVYVRLNTLKTSESEVLEIFEGDRLAVEKVPLLNHVYRIIEAEQPLVRTRGFREGLFVVQDLAGCLAVEAAMPETSSIVFDVCAAPGLKANYFSMLMRNAGEIYALDYSKRALRALRLNAARLGVENVVPVLADARVSLPFHEAADLVFLDPPCTESGALARVPSLKWRLSHELVSRMAEIQWEMLRNCAFFVKVGGCLVYFTNSIFVEENEMLIERFLRVFPDFRLVETLPRAGLPGLRGLDKCQRFYSHVHGCESGFLARLKRVS